MIYRVIDCSATITQVTFDMCFKLRLWLWWILLPANFFDTTTFFAVQSSHSKILTSLKLKTSSAKTPTTCSMMHFMVVFKCSLGTCNRGFSWGNEIVSKSSAFLIGMNESTHPLVTSVYSVTWIERNMSVLVTGNKRSACFQSKPEEAVPFPPRLLGSVLLSGELSPEPGLPAQLWRGHWTHGIGLIWAIDSDNQFGQIAGSLRFTATEIVNSERCHLFP
jgi:hypothetical protein